MWSRGGAALAARPVPLPGGILDLASDGEIDFDIDRYLFGWTRAPGTPYFVASAGPGFGGAGAK